MASRPKRQVALRTFSKGDEYCLLRTRACLRIFRGKGSEVAMTSIMILDEGARHGTKEDPPQIVLLLNEASSSWSTIERVRAESDGSTLIMVLTNPMPQDYLMAISSGVDGVIQIDAPLYHLLAVIDAAHRKAVLLPQEAVIDLCRRRMGWAASRALSEWELRVLARLAAGTTIVDLAREEAWSERTMRRRLERVYAMLDAKNRVEAIAHAAQLGLIGAP